MEKQELNTSWTLWFHKFDDEKWDLESYSRLCSFNTIELYQKEYNFDYTFEKHAKNLRN